MCSLHSVCINAQDKLNALNLAACGGHVEIVKYLIPKFQSSVNFDLDDDGDTCLHYAAQEGHLALVKCLIDNCGFNPNLGNKVSCDVCTFCMLFPHALCVHMHARTHTRTHTTQF